MYDSRSMRRFVGLDLGQSAAPDETTICRFRHLLERNDLGKAVFEYVLEHLERHGIKVGKGTIVDASIISAPPSTKNKDRARDPEMHQTRKGKQWYFGMKAHIGMDRRTKVIHTVAATAANVHDATCLGQLLHGEETEVWGDSAYQGQGALVARHAPNAQDMTHTGAAGAAARSTNGSGRGTGRSRGCGPGSSMRFWSSSASSASRRRATGGCRRTPTGCSSRAR